MELKFESNGWTRWIPRDEIPPGVSFRGYTIQVDLGSPIVDCIVAKKVNETTIEYLVGGPKVYVTSLNWGTKEFFRVKKPSGLTLLENLIKTVDKPVDCSQKEVETAV